MPVLNSQPAFLPKEEILRPVFSLTVFENGWLLKAATATFDAILFLKIEVSFS